MTSEITIRFLRFPSAKNHDQKNWVWRFHRYHLDELSGLILVFLTQQYTLVIWIKSWQKVVSNYFPTKSFQNCQIGDFVTFIFISHHWFSAIVNRLYLTHLKSITYGQQTNKMQVWLVSKIFPSISKLLKNKSLFLQFYWVGVTRQHPPEKPLPCAHFN